MKRTSSILGPDGSPIVLKVLSDEIATPTVSGVRRTHEERVATGLTPERLGTILRDAQEGSIRAYLTLAEEMEERYLHYASQLQTRRMAIESVDLTIETPKGVNTKVVDNVTEVMNNPLLGEARGNLIDGISKSFAAVEMMWEYERGALQPVDYVARDPRFFQFDRLSLRELRLAVDGSIEGERLPEAKFLRHIPRTRLGVPVRRGMARPAAWGYLIQQFTLQDWAAFSEVYGMPLRVGKYNANASPADKRTLLKAVTSIANDAAAIIPAGMDIEFHEVNGTNGAAVFSGLLDYVDKQISKLVLGQTMTSDNGSSLGQAKIHNEVRLDILRADCRQLAFTVNRDLIKPFVDLNFGPQDVYPTVELPVPDPEDVEALSKVLKDLVPFGLRVKAAEVREKIGLSDPDEDDEVLVAPKKSEPEAETTDDEEGPIKPNGRNRTAALAAKVLHNRGCGCATCTAPTTFSAEPVSSYESVVDESGLDEVDRLFASTLDGWQEMSAPILDPLTAILDTATSFEEALAMLHSAGPDASKLAEKLATMTAIARGIGDVRD